MVWLEQHRRTALNMKHCVCMVSDFFYPNMGGVESHIFQLSQCLLERGHKVIVVTHFYGDRIGIKYMTNYLKVYYLPIVPFYNKSILPTIIGTLPYLRTILLTENVSIVHGHSAFSSLAHEAMFVASLLDIPSVFTDHSLFGFSDASAIVTNSFLRYSLANASHTICVSHTGKENTVLRSGVLAEEVSVIPNAVDSVKFSPDLSAKHCDSSHRSDLSVDRKHCDSTHRSYLFKNIESCDNTDGLEDKVPCDKINRTDKVKNGRIKLEAFPNLEKSPKHSSISCSRGDHNLHNPHQKGPLSKPLARSTVTVVIGSRLVYRKGIDLVAELLPVLCRQKLRHQGRLVRVNFLISGDGPKRILLEEVIEKYKLHKRVKMLGELQHCDMRDKLLIKGDIFLNTSLTEAFCMAIVEAVSCGLTVVSTNVGGIPEVLPEEYIYLVEPNLASILRGIHSAIKDILDGRRPSARDCNEFVKRSYCWRNVAARTEVVYRTVAERKVPSVARKVRRLWECGPMAGPMMAMVFLACHYILILLNWINPIYEVADNLHTYENKLHKKKSQYDTNAAFDY